MAPNGKVHCVVFASSEVNGRGINVETKVPSFNVSLTHHPNSSLLPYLQNHLLRPLFPKERSKHEEKFFMEEIAKRRQYAIALEYYKFLVPLLG